MASTMQARTLVVAVSIVRIAGGYPTSTGGVLDERDR
jgi:hypothetical protein